MVKEEKIILFFFFIARPEESSSSTPDAEVCSSSRCPLIFCGPSATADPRNMGVWGNNGEIVVALDPERALVLMKTRHLSDFDTYTFLTRHEDIF